MIQVLSLFKSKYTWIGIIILCISVYTASLKISNSNTLLELKDEQRRSETLLNEKKAVEERLANSESQLQSLIRQIVLKEKIIREQKTKIDSINKKYESKKDDIRQLEETDDEVSKYLNTIIPESLFNRLSVQE